MTSKHTPGPWTAYELGDEDGTWKEWSIVANGPLAYGGDNGNGVENSKANAQLMAVAPELLTALERLYEAGEWQRTISNEMGPVVGNAYAKARAAIAKARGSL